MRIYGFVGRPCLPGRPLQSRGRQFNSQFLILIPVLPQIFPGVETEFWRFLRECPLFFPSPSFPFQINYMIRSLKNIQVMLDNYDSIPLSTRMFWSTKQMFNVFLVQPVVAHPAYTKSSRRAPGKPVDFTRCASPPDKEGAVSSRI